MFLALVLVIAWPAPARATTLERLSIEQLSQRATMVDARGWVVGGFQGKLDVAGGRLPGSDETTATMSRRIEATLRAARSPARPASGARRAATEGARVAREGFPPKCFWGHMSDSTDGHMLPGVAVKATQPSTGLVHTTSTDAAGYQTIPHKLWLSLIWHSAGPGDPGDGHVDEALTPTSTPTPTPLGVIFYDGFEGSGPPWTFDGNPTWAVTTYRAAVGQRSAYCAGSTIGAPGPYATDMKAWLVAGPVDLSAVTWATLQFKLYMDTQKDADDVGWCASTDGTDYSGWRDSGNSRGWIDKSCDLTAVPTLGNLCGRSQVWIAFGRSIAPACYRAATGLLCTSVTYAVLGPQEPGASSPPSSRRAQAAAFGLRLGR